MFVKSLAREYMLPHERVKLDNHEKAKIDELVNNITHSTGYNNFNRIKLNKRKEK